MRANTNRAVSLRYITVTAIMSAISFVLMLLEFSTPITPAFLKFDFSDLPAFITSFALGPVWGVAVELIKNLLHMPFSATSFVGELANFIIGTCLVVPAGLVYKLDRTRRGALIGSFTGALFAAVVSFPVNYFIMYPFYSAFFDWPMEKIVSLYSAIFPAVNTLTRALLIVNVPFTFIKGTVSAVITFAVYKKLSPIIKGKRKEI